MEKLQTGAVSENVEKKFLTHPNPQMRRKTYVNLNGSWDFCVSRDDGFPAEYPQTIQVPFCPESQLSGLEMEVLPGSYLFYRRTLEIPEITGRVLLHVGAADQISEIYVNQKLCGKHVGGYNSFTVDLTDALQPGENELVIRVLDDLRDKTLPYGKQTLKRGGMWYTPVSGIWQTVWLEYVPCSYIQELTIETDLTCARITVAPALSGKVYCKDTVYELKDGVAVITPENPNLWSPENPYLYEFIVETQEDRVESYFALRQLSIQKVGEYPHLCLNGKPVFFHGLLDQGYWPDGLYTPPSDAHFAEDILKMKRLGFNTLRKHIKVEPEIFYYLCDVYGMFVFQDMVNNGDYSFLRDTVLPTFGFQKRNDRRLHKEKKAREAFLCGMEQTVRQLKNHPCVVYWTIFNEGWGQFCSQEAYEKLKKLDNSRFVGSTSGWFKGADSDVQSHHLYYTWVTKWEHLRAGEKPLVLTEFGGYSCPVKGHIFNPDKVYGYRLCDTEAKLQDDLLALYTQRIIPLKDKGLCAAIYTQVSDVEDEINGLLTYDRKVCKVETKIMQKIADKLKI